VPVEDFSINNYSQVRSTELSQTLTSKVFRYGAEENDNLTNIPYQNDGPHHVDGPDVRTPRSQREGAI
jgi:hypothetical protein